MRLHAIFAFAIGLACLHLCTSPASAAQCSGSFRFTGPQTEIGGKTGKDVLCTIYYGKRSDIDGYQIVQKPAHGTIGSAGYRGSRLLTAYKPEPGYTGADEFTLSVD